MPTVDRKNDTDEKHSLFSFDKRKVQSVTFGARQQGRKKYKVVKHKYGSAAPDKDFRAPPEHENLDKPSTDTKALVRLNNSKPSPHNRTSVENFDNSRSGISPEMAQRMKRAAFLAQQNKEAIMLNTATVISDETETEKMSEIPDGNFSKNKENKAENRVHSFESRFTGNSENIAVGEKSDERHSFAVNKAYEKHRENLRRKQHESAEKSSVLDNISQTADIAVKLAHGEVGKVAADIVVRNAFSENGLRDTAQTIGSAVSGSTSVESAVPDVAATLAAVEAKKFVAKIMKGESSEKDKKFVDEHKANGRTKYVDTEKERHRVEHCISDNEGTSEDMSREERRNFLHNKRVAEKAEVFLCGPYADRAEKQAEGNVP